MEQVCCIGALALMTLSMAWQSYQAWRNPDLTRRMGQLGGSEWPNALKPLRQQWVDSPLYIWWVRALTTTAAIIGLLVLLAILINGFPF